MDTEERYDIRLNDVTIGYGSTKRIVAKGLNAIARQGTMTCLLGRNGMGKSTLLRTVARLQPKQDGTIAIGEKPISEYTTRQFARTVSIVLTQRPYATDLTVKETVALGRTPYTDFWGRMAEEDRIAAKKAMEDVGITKMADRRICTLSDGEMQKVMIAKSLAQQTPVILLDEPTAFLDFPGKIGLLLMLRRIAHEEKKTILISTHDLETTLHTADYLWLLRQEGMATGTPHELAEKGEIKKYIGREDVTLDNDTLNLKIHTKGM